MQATTAPGSSSGEFVDKTDLAPGTKWTATDANAWQAELLEVITEAGLVPSGGDLTQVRKAIQALAKLVKVDASIEADVLSTARTIGGVSFDGSANINLPGVNTAGNQDTSGKSGGMRRTYKPGDTYAIGTYLICNSSTNTVVYELKASTGTVPSNTYFFSLDVSF